MKQLQDATAQIVDQTILDQLVAKANDHAKSSDLEYHI
jgi:hypothetical protein